LERGRVQAVGRRESLPVRAQAMVRVPWNDLNGSTWKITDVFTGQVYERSGDEMTNAGLYVDLPPWGFHVLTGWVRKA